MPGVSALSASLAVVIGFALIQFVSGRLAASGPPMSRAWMSFAGGIAVGYVFLHLLPELAVEQARLAREWGKVVSAGYAIHLTALMGLTFFFAVERACKLVQQAGQHGATEVVLHYGSFALYNASIGYVSIHRAELGMGVLLLYLGAIGPHILLNGYALQDVHREHMRIGRWVLSLALLAGWSAGALMQMPPSAPAFFFAFLAGGVILNALKEELPTESESRLWAFLLGLIVYGSIIFLISRLHPEALEPTPTSIHCTGACLFSSG